MHMIGYFEIGFHIFQVHPSFFVTPPSSLTPSPSLFEAKTLASPKPNPFPFPIKNQPICKDWEVNSRELPIFLYKLKGMVVGTTVIMVTLLTDKNFQQLSHISIFNISGLLLEASLEVFKAISIHSKAQMVANTIRSQNMFKIIASPPFQCLDCYIYNIYNHSIPSLRIFESL